LYDVTNPESNNHFRSYAEITELR